MILRFTFIFALCSAFALNTFAQVYKTGTSTVSFYSSTPVEDIQAKNTGSAAAVNAETGEVAFKVPMKSFNFPNKLMQEHFNEKYLYTDKHPFATFKGKVTEPALLLKEGETKVTAIGTLVIHGVEQKKEFTGTWTKSGEKAVLIADFKVPLKEHNIKVPTIVLYKVAEVIDVKCEFNLQAK